MEKLEQLQNEYLRKIEELINSLRTKGKEEKIKGNEFEYTKTIIQINIAEIYKKMFNVAKRQSENESSFYQIYIGLLNNINSPWKERFSKDKQFGMDEESIIEEIKIATSDELIKIFKECFKNIFEVQNGWRFCENI